MSAKRKWNFLIDGNVVKFGSGKKVVFDHPVAQTLECDEVLIVRLDIPSDVEYPRNVFAIDDEGAIVWQVPDRPGDKTSVYKLVRHIVVLWNYDGSELFVEPRTGELLLERLSR